MALEFRLPDIGEGLTEAQVVRWLVEVGDEVGVDQPVVELETDKAVVEIPAPGAGTILHLGAAEGSTLEVGQVLVVIGEAGEDWKPGASTSDAAPIVGNLEEARDQQAPARPPEQVPPTEVAVPGVQALPLVRRLARDLGVDLTGVHGTGPGGRVTRQDVEAAVSTVDGERVRMSPTRRAIARNLVRSWREIPHVTTYGTAPAEPLLARRRSLQRADEPLPLEALFVERLVPILQRHREFNAYVDGEDVVYRERVDVGIAVDTPAGLLVAVVRSADDMDVDELGAEVARLAAAGRDRTITPSEMRGAGFTLSNIGAVGGGFGTPIIPYGSSAILSVGRAEERPVVRDGQLQVGREFPLSLSYDHRIIDGAAGRAFMADLIEVLEAG